MIIYNSKLLSGMEKKLYCSFNFSFLSFIYKCMAIVYRKTYC